MRKCKTCGEVEFPHRYQGEWSHKFISNGDGRSDAELVKEIRCYLKHGVTDTEKPWPAFYDMAAELCDRLATRRRTGHGGC